MKDKRKKKHKVLNMVLTIVVLTVIAGTAMGVIVIMRFGVDPIEHEDVDFRKIRVSRTTLNNFLVETFPKILKTNRLPVRVGNKENGVVEYMYPKGYSPLWVTETVSDALKSLGIKGFIVQRVEDVVEVHFTVWVGDVDATQLSFIGDRDMTKGIISIIIDDFGYNINKRAQEFITLDVPLSVAVIPGHEYSDKIAEMALSYGKEVLLHQPMEPLESTRGEEDYLVSVGMPGEEIRSRVLKGLEAIPGATGISNHQGSRATADPDLMKKVLEVVVGQGIYFVDSYTHSYSVGLIEARKMGVPSVRRSVFLDDENDRMSVGERIEMLKDIARSNDYAIGIGHINEETLRTLKEKIPQIKAEGYTFAYPYQLAR